jgi:hypothetical protein
MLTWPSKDTDEILDYQLDWNDPVNPRLEATEELVSSDWSVVQGDVVIDSSSFAVSGLSTVWLSGGTTDTKCILLNRVTTSLGRTYDQSVVLRIRTH